MNLTLAIAAAEGGGFNPLDPAGLGGLLWTLIIFLIALPFMWKIVMGPITTALAERDDRAARAITAAEKAGQDAEKVRAEMELKLGDAKADAAKLMSEARERGETREREILEQAKADAEAMVERAKHDINTAKEQALSAIREEVVEISLSAAGQVLRRTVDSEDDRRLVSDLVAVTKTGSGKAGRA
jgi:F-type H+-transporting ATPase subunit b